MSLPRLTYVLEVAEDGTISSEYLASQPRYRLLLILLSAIIVVGAIERTLYFRLKAEFDLPGSGFGWFLNSVLQPAAFLLLVGSKLAASTATRKGSHSAASVSTRLLIFLGMLDAISQTLLLLSLPHISLTAANSLANSTVLFSIFGSRMLLSKSYSTPHYVGAAIVMAGSLFSVFFAVHNEQAERAMWILPQLLAYVASSVSWIVKEKTLKETGVDIWSFSLWIVTYQFPFLLMTFWIVSIHSFAGVPMKDFDGYIEQATRCFFTGTATDPTSQQQQIPRRCAGPPVIVFLPYAALDLAMRLLSLLVLRHGSTTVFTMAVAIYLPVAQFARSLKFFAGQNTAMVTKTDAFALVFMVIGMVSYVSAPELGADDESRVDPLDTRLLQSFEQLEKEKRRGLRIEDVRSMAQRMLYHQERSATQSSLNPDSIGFQQARCLVLTSEGDEDEDSNTFDDGDDALSGGGAGACDSPPPLSYTAIHQA